MKIPLQVRHESQRLREPPQIPESVHLAAYEVYCRIFAPQQTMIEGNCRGGFGAEELIALLYARSFPRDEWRERFDECFESGELKV